MHVDTAKWWDLQDFLWKDLPKGCYDKNIRILFFQDFHCLRLADALWLVDRNIMFHRPGLDCRKLHLLASALWLIRLRHHHDDLVSCLCNGIRRCYREIRCSHKNNFHSPSPLCFLFFIIYIMQIAFYLFGIHMSVQMVDLM